MVHIGTKYKIPVPLIKDVNLGFWVILCLKTTVQVFKVAVTVYTQPSWKLVASYINISTDEEKPVTNDGILPVLNDKYNWKTPIIKLYR